MKWEGGDPGVAHQKTPTCLLLTPEGAFHSFGYTARDYYHDLDPEEARDWLYFEKFKMKIHSATDLTLKTQLKAVNGKKMPALEVFAHALRFFKEHALQELREQSPSLPEKHTVCRVLTVPAIWKQPAKQFMREAAYLAGLVSRENAEQLLIALEPEAASVYWCKLRLHQLLDLSSRAPGGGRLSDFQQAREQLRRSRHSRTFLVESGVGELWAEMQAGDRYVVADCGGGTWTRQCTTLKELYKASGGPYGAVGVDLAFEQLLCRIFGEDFIATFKRQRPAAWVDLTIAFEARKRTAGPHRPGALNISLPFSFIDFYRKLRGYAPNVFGIIQYIEALLARPEVQGVKLLFLVGGFAESAVLQHAVKAALGARGLRVVVLHDVGLTILKGAVLFGQAPCVVRVCRSPLTYGVGVLNRFVPGRHLPEKLLVRDGRRWCTDVFERFVASEQSVALGEEVRRSYCPARPGQRRVLINLYCCAAEDAHFITDPGVRNLELEPAYCGQDIRATMQFGNTEIKVTAIDVSTNHSVRTSIDFFFFN
uniref:Heat shock protein family A (Hsp70) member 12B n=1 Tax=Aotus nancymaae TaxID=37293 RepID=A0A2K5D4B6_AOTNA